MINGTEEQERHITVTDDIAVVDKLNPGTNYNLTIWTMINNLTSTKAKTLLEFTSKILQFFL
jgi:hypothetical protein